jgi:tyrosinase
MADPRKRLREVSGRSTGDPPYKNITLDFKLKMGTLAEKVPIGDVMDISLDPLCYKYM